MKNVYTLCINSQDKALARYKITYIDSKFKSLERLSGKINDVQHKFLMNFAPLEESSISSIQEKWNIKGIYWEKKEDFNDEKLHGLLMNIYFNWYVDKYDFEPKINMSDTKALKLILSYFKKVSSSSEEITSIFKSIFDNWSNYPAFLQNKTNLTSINQYLNEFLKIIITTNGTKKSKFSR